MLVAEVSMEKRRSKESKGGDQETEIDGWIEKYSKKYHRSFWKKRLTGEKSWHHPESTETRAIERNEGSRIASKIVELKAGDVGSGWKGERKSQGRGDVREEGLSGYSYDDNETRSSNSRQVSSNSDDKRKDEGGDDGSEGFTSSYALRIDNIKQLGYNGKADTKLNSSKNSYNNDALSDNRYNDHRTKNMNINDYEKNNDEIETFSFKPLIDISKNDTESEWESHISRKHNRIYYRNKLTNETSWSIPVKSPRSTTLSKSHYSSNSHDNDNNHNSSDTNTMTNNANIMYDSNKKSDSKALSCDNLKKKILNERPEFQDIIDDEHNKYMNQSKNILISDEFYNENNKKSVTNGLPEKHSKKTYDIENRKELRTNHYFGKYDTNESDNSKNFEIYDTEIMSEKNDNDIIYENNENSSNLFSINKNNNDTNVPLQIEYLGNEMKSNGRNNYNSDTYSNIYSTNSKTTNIRPESACKGTVRNEKTIPNFENEPFRSHNYPEYDNNDVDYNGIRSGKGDYKDNHVTRYTGIGGDSIMGTGENLDNDTNKNFDRENISNHSGNNEYLESEVLHLLNIT